jgi:hypothetical protein
MDNGNNQGSFKNACVEMKLVSEKPSKTGVMMMTIDPSFLSQISGSSSNKPKARFRKNGFFSSMTGSMLGFHEPVRNMTPVATVPRKEKMAPKAEEQQEKEGASLQEGLVVAEPRKKHDAAYHLKDELPYHLKAERISAEYEQKNGQDDSAQASKDKIPTTPNINVSGYSDLQNELKYPTIEPFAANTPSISLSSDEAKLNKQLEAADAGTQAARDPATDSSQTTSSSSDTPTKPTYAK